MKRLYVGNLAPGAREDDVRAAFSRFGTVTSVTLVEDRYTGRPKGFGYVEMEEGDAAIAGLNRTDFLGQPLTVCAARPKNPPLGEGQFLAREPRGALSQDRSSWRADQR